jgi:hypothetical protein
MRAIHGLGGALLTMVCVFGITSVVRAGVVVVGGLGNFDCTNNTPNSEDEFEIEFPSVDPSAIASFWSNTPAYKGSGYGAPTSFKAASSDGIVGHTSTFVDYKKTGIATPVNFTEHFGVHFVNATFNPPNTVYTWKNSGVPFTYNLPTVTTTTAPNTSGGVTVTPVLTNNTNASIGVEFRSGTTGLAGTVQLGDLVDTNAEVQIIEAETEPGDNGLAGVILGPGQALGIDGEAHDITDSIIVNPHLWLSQHPGAGTLFDVNLNAPGDSMMATVRVFSVTGNTLGPMVSNMFLALNTVSSVPEPGSCALFAIGLVVAGGFGSRRWFGEKRRNSISL